MGDGNCMFRSVAYLATNDDENHISLRLLLQRFENLSKKVFNEVLTRINKPTIEEHITHIGKPNTWGTHVELFATASYFQVPAFMYTIGDATNLRLEVFWPLSNNQNLHYPVTLDDDECFRPPCHFELLYYSNCHYHCILKYSTEKPSTTVPQLTIVKLIQVSHRRMKSLLISHFVRILYSIIPFHTVYRLYPLLRIYHMIYISEE